MQLKIPLIDLEGTPHGKLRVEIFSCDTENEIKLNHEVSHDGRNSFSKVIKLLDNI